MKTKIKSLLLVFVLVICAFSLVGLSGCGDVSIKALAETFEDLDQTYEKYSTSGNDVFSNAPLEKVSPNFSTKYKLAYGTSVDTAVKNDASDAFYGELETKYNYILAIANDFIDGQARTSILALPTNLNAATKSAINDVDAKIKAVISYIPQFVSERRELVDHFVYHPGNTDSIDAKEIVRLFKKSYGTLIEKCVNLANSMANVLEKSSILDTLAKSGTKTDSEIIRDYLRVRVLPIYTELTYVQVHDEMNWDPVLADAKTEGNKLLDLAKNLFNNNIKNTLLAKECKASNKLEDLIAQAKDFAVEQQDYIKSVRGINFKNWDVKYKGVLEEYKKANKFVEIYIEKCTQFLSCTAIGFLNYVQGIICV